jgi:hypothetical protein
MEDGAFGHGENHRLFDRPYRYGTDNSTGNCIAKDEAKGEMMDAMREVANSSIRFNKKMYDEDKLVYGIHPTDTTLTYHGTPTSQPGTEVENARNHYEHLVRAINTERGDHSKPTDAYGVRYAWQVGGEKPASGTDLPKSKFSRKTSHVVHTQRRTRGRRRFIQRVTGTARGTRDCGLRWLRRLSGKRGQGFAQTPQFPAKENKKHYSHARRQGWRRAVC